MCDCVCVCMSVHVDEGEGGGVPGEGCKGEVGIMRREIFCHEEHITAAVPVCPCMLMGTSQSQECVTLAGGLTNSPS